MELFFCALRLVRDGHAYVCHEQSRSQLSQKVKAEADDSSFRGRNSEENMTQFMKMLMGVYEPGEAVLRLKFKSESGFKDPVIYRVNKLRHSVTFDDWKIYPTYDFCHPICDSLEGIGLSLCSEEFQNHRQLYEWILTTLDLPVPDQREFPRLRFPFNITSKRLIAELKDSIIGVDDPRLLTIAGLRRRGYPAEVLRNFASAEPDQLKLEYLQDVAREYFDTNCNRRFVVISPLRCRVTNFAEFKESCLLTDPRMSVDFDGNVTFEVPNHPARPELGTRVMTISEDVFINKFDFSEDREKKGHYLTTTNGVYLKYASTMMTVQEAIHDNEQVTQLLVHLNKVREKPKKVKILTWVSKALPGSLNLFGNLLTNITPLPGVPISDQVNGASWRTSDILVETSILETVKFAPNFEFGQTFQAERIGYVTVDEAASFLNLELNFTCFLNVHPEMIRNIVEVCDVRQVDGSCPVLRRVASY